MKRGQSLIEARQALADRYERYRDLRDSGVLVTDAGRELGLTWTATRQLEAAYKRERNLPPGGKRTPGLLS